MDANEERRVEPPSPRKSKGRMFPTLPTIMEEPEPTSPPKTETPTSGCPSMIFSPKEDCDLFSSSNGNLNENDPINANVDME